MGTRIAVGAVALVAVVGVGVSSPAASSGLVRLSSTSRVHCRAPETVGLSLDKAVKRLRHAGCRVGAIRRHVSSVRRENRVLRQHLPAGERRAGGAKVGLLVGKGPRQLLPEPGPIVPRRLPPYIAYDWYDAGTNASEARLVAPDGSDSRTAQFGASPSWSPDATEILSIVGCPFIWAAGPDGSDGHVLFPPGASLGPGGCVDNVEQPHWSPDGRAIVFTWWPDVPHPIYIENADGSDLHPVPNTEGGQDASFSPDGRWIIFDKPDQQTGVWSHVYAIRVDGTGRRRLTNWSGEGASWSPDGTRIIYACATHPEADSQLADPGDDVAPHAVCVISNRHPMPRTLYVNPKQAVTDPTWNADGSKILITIREQIALLSPSGGTPVMITHPPGSASAPDW